MEEGQTVPITELHELFHTKLSQLHDHQIDTLTQNTGRDPKRHDGDDRIYDKDDLDYNEYHCDYDGDDRNYDKDDRDYN